MGQMFKINLKDAHEKTGLTFYAVSKQTGLAHNTVQKYAESVVTSTYIPATVVVLAEFYGVDWRAPAIVEVIEGDASAPERKTTRNFNRVKGN